GSVVQHLPVPASLPQYQLDEAQREYGAVAVQYLDDSTLECLASCDGQVKVQPWQCFGGNAYDGVSQQQPQQQQGYQGGYQGDYFHQQAQQSPFQQQRQQQEPPQQQQEGTTWGNGGHLPEQQLVSASGVGTHGSSGSGVPDRHVGVGYSDGRSGGGGGGSIDR
ncbi:unnamed protein product, partial [Ectocarpus sp. 4 AP-2014]